MHVVQCATGIKLLRRQRRKSLLRQLRNCPRCILQTSRATVIAPLFNSGENNVFIL